MTQVLVSIGLSVAAAAAVMTATALVARRQGRVAVVDVAWGAAFVAAAVGCGAFALLDGAGDAGRTCLLAALVAVWGIRLAWHIGVRTARHRDEDPRYEKQLGGTLAEVGMARAVRKVFALQGAIVPVIALPLSVGVVLDVRWWPVVALGAVVWAVGLVFEAVGDAQLAAYRARPRDQRPQPGSVAGRRSERFSGGALARRGRDGGLVAPSSDRNAASAPSEGRAVGGQARTQAQVLDTGLWAWTRHPNYFGDACVWWGIWLAGGLASGWVAGLATVLAPAAMTYFLVFATGARLLEQTMMKRPGYPEYAMRTSRFLPRPPRR